MNEIYLHEDFWTDAFWFFIFVICAVTLAYSLLKIFFYRKDLVDQSQLNATTRAYQELTMQEHRQNNNYAAFHFRREISKAEYLENNRKIRLDLIQAETEYKEASRILHG